MEAVKELFSPSPECASMFDRRRITPVELQRLRKALSGIEESIQELNTPFEIDNESQLKRALKRILGESLVASLREGTLVRLIDSVNLHSDREMVDEQGIQSHFIVFVLEANTDDDSIEFVDSAQGSELIHVNSDNQMISSYITTGRVISFDATKPHAYLNASFQESLLLIVDFY